ncbi:MAG: GDP-mannose 4,6-dehydratase, partial [Candidatus Contendobacter sp.]|nr:GDP-mannose 4,6-dehydratase [Candidatus Contendobacter sp.]
ELGVTVRFEGVGVNEIGIVETVAAEGLQLQPGQTIVAVDPRYFRPTEVETLLGDPSKAREKLGWTPTTRFAELVREMVEEDFKLAQRDRLIQHAGFKAFNHHE